MEYRIGSFNMRRFGKDAKKDFNKIVEIIRGENLDVVAFQEIFSGGAGMNNLFNTCMRQLYEWDYRCGFPFDSNDYSKLMDNGQINRGEGYAFAWNKRKFKIAEYIEGISLVKKKDGSADITKAREFEPRIINTLSNDVNSNVSFFARAPYYIRLQPLYGGFYELRLINIHIYYGNQSLTEIEKRQQEFTTLVKDIYPQIAMRRYGNFRQAFTFALGDYNLNIFNPLINPDYKNCYASRVFNYSEGSTNYGVVTLQSELTTLRQSQDTDSNNNEENYYGSDPHLANNFDHVTYSPELSKISNIQCNAIDAVNKYCGGDYEYYEKNISDHLPIVAVIRV